MLDWTNLRLVRRKNLAYQMNAVSQKYNVLTYLPQDIGLALGKFPHCRNAFAAGLMTLSSKTTQN